MRAVACLSSVESIRKHVLEVLCKHENLASETTPLAEARITRAGRSCGLFFQVQGPRRVRAYAVWASEENRLLFYDSTGLRFAETHIVELPEINRMAA